MVMTMAIMGNKNERCYPDRFPPFHENKKARGGQRGYPGKMDTSEDCNMKRMKASEFKAKCLHLMDEVNRTGEEIEITKNGKPVSILKAYRTVPETLFGLHKGKIHSKDDLTAPLDIKWDASNACA